VIGTWSFKIKRRTPTYTCRVTQRRRKAGARRRRVDNGSMLFDQPRELPVATVHRAPGSIGSRIAGALQRWIAARWSWLSPRMVPVIVAAIGLVLVVNAVNYLSQPAAASICAGAAAPADPPPSHIRVVLNQ
jgi:hypothetical protein